MIVVVGVAVGASVFAPGTSAFSAVQAIEAVPGSHTMAALETERKQLIAMTAAARTLTVVAKPKLASPTQVAAADVAAGTSTGTTGTGGRGVVYVTSTPPDPGTAQSTAYNMMASFGFSPQTYFGCLVDIWNLGVYVDTMRRWIHSWPGAPTTRHNQHQRVITFFFFCVEQGWMKENPARKIKKVAPEQDEDAAVHSRTI